MNHSLLLDPQASARQAGLRYVQDDEPGIRRRRRGKGFSYSYPDGSPASAEDRERIKHLAIPPAWTHVWICLDPLGHLQATGRDEKGRKQYRYHEAWQELRNLAKFDKLVPFGRALPALRAKVDEDLSRRGLCRERVLAGVVMLLERTLIRVGNEEYARTNETYGLTTLRGEHVECTSGRLSFHFRGKSGKEKHLDLSDRRLARLVKRCQELPGQHLFAWRDGDRIVRVTSEEVNAYIASLIPIEASAKDFRTWGGTVRAFQELRGAEPPGSEREIKKTVNAAIKAAAAQLGNTPAVCRSYYIHPVVPAAYADGRLLELRLPSRPPRGLSRSEAGLLRLLEQG